MRLISLPIISAAVTKSTLPPLPLAIDVDGTLLRSDITQEMFWLGLFKFPWLAPKIFTLIKNDRPALKALLMPKLKDQFDPEHLPYNPLVLKYAREHKMAGGEVILCSGSEDALIKRIADHLSDVDAGFGTSETINLVKGNKSKFLQERYPDGFIYMGNSNQDFDVWVDADVALAIAPPKGVDDIHDKHGNPVTILEPRESELPALFEAMRPATWPYILMSVLCVRYFWPPMGLHGDGAGVIALAITALITFMSGGILMSDLRRAARHRTQMQKKFKPLASGRLGASTSVIAGTILMAAGLGIFMCLPNAIKAAVAVSFVTCIAGSSLISFINRVFR